MGAIETDHSCAGKHVRAARTERRAPAAPCGRELAPPQPGSGG